jgi:hypothetical protein
MRASRSQSRMRNSHLPSGDCLSKMTNAVPQQTRIARLWLRSKTGRVRTRTLSRAIESAHIDRDGGRVPAVQSSLDADRAPRSKPCRVMPLFNLMEGMNHGVLDLHQHSRADEDLPRFGLIAKTRGNVRNRPDGRIIEASLSTSSLPTTEILVKS